uniref:Putative secreted protein n=1 Tax=Panstrongylus lignarius TaxID=156445 RepID=A0A224XTN3_9HEMI
MGCITKKVTVFLLKKNKILLFINFALCLKLPILIDCCKPSFCAYLISFLGFGIKIFSRKESMPWIGTNGIRIRC